MVIAINAQSVVTRETLRNAAVSAIEKYMDDMMNSFTIPELTASDLGFETDDLQMLRGVLTLLFNDINKQSSYLQG